jgi:hypothetical protein
MVPIPVLFLRYREDIAAISPGQGTERLQGRSGRLGGLRGEMIGQLAWAAEADVVAAVHLVGVDP